MAVNNTLCCGWWCCRVVCLQRLGHCTVDGVSAPNSGTCEPGRRMQRRRPCLAVGMHMLAVGCSCLAICCTSRCLFVPGSRAHECGRVCVRILHSAQRIASCAHALAALGDAPLLLPRQAELHLEALMRSTVGGLHCMLTTAEQPQRVR